MVNIYFLDLIVFEKAMAPIWITESNLAMLLDKEVHKQ